ncbi:MAG: ROK family protein, partial [Lactiplantibacillus plantarum]|nr:ROK family protein [Lactiplantibacillus plantarum]
LSLMLAATTGTNFKITGETGSAVKMITAIAHQLQLPDRHDGHQVFAAIADGNPDAERIFEAYGMEVAQIILNVQAVLDVMTVAIGGGISAQPSVVPMICKQYAALLQQYPVIGTTLSKPEIVPAKFHSGQHDWCFSGTAESLNMTDWHCLCNCLLQKFCQFLAK